MKIFEDDDYLKVMIKKISPPEAFMIGMFVSVALITLLRLITA